MDRPGSVKLAAGLHLLTVRVGRRVQGREVDVRLFQTTTSPWERVGVLLRLLNMWRGEPVVDLLLLELWGDTSSRDRGREAGILRSSKAFVHSRVRVVVDIHPILPDRGVGREDSDLVATSCQFCG
jgi:hypothetical protein